MKRLYLQDCYQTASTQRRLPNTLHSLTEERAVTSTLAVLTSISLPTSPVRHPCYKNTNTSPDTSWLHPGTSRDLQTHILFAFANPHPKQCYQTTNPLRRREAAHTRSRPSKNCRRYFLQSPRESCAQHISVLGGALDDNMDCWIQTRTLVHR
jgi:hypothetical protein